MLRSKTGKKNRVIKVRKGAKHTLNGITVLWWNISSMILYYCIVLYCGTVLFYSILYSILSYSVV